jgi:hypothetical protein
MKGEQKVLIAILILLICTYIAVYGVIPILTRFTYTQGAAAQAIQKVAYSGEATSTASLLPQVQHLATPAEVKAIYMSSCVAGTTAFRKSLVDLVDSTELNTLIIDIKDFSGYLSYKPEDPELHKYVSPRCYAPDMKEFIALLHQKNIYVIGRITSFQDPIYATEFPAYAVKRESDGGIWSDKKGIHYLDPGAEPVWNHLLAISKDAYAIGFDELNFDYIRFPSDGNMKDIAFPYSENRPKPEVMESFFSYLNSQLKPLGVVLSADFFGMTTTSYSDLGIGQVLERALPYFDYVAPMVYPSHFPPTFNGWADPNKHVYELVAYTMGEAAVRTEVTSTRIHTFSGKPIASTTPQLYTKESYPRAKLRTWIQDFDYGGNYDIAEVKDQIRASDDVGVTSWMIWSPSNHYTVGALLPDRQANLTSSSSQGTM